MLQVLLLPKLLQLIIFLWSVGISHIYNAMMHIAFPGMAANYIGWVNSPFQLEVGFASLGLGLAALLGVKKDFRTRLAIAIASSVFLWGCAGGHLYQLYRFHDHAPGNAGIMLWVDLLQPVISIAALVISRSFEKREELLQLINNYKIFSITVPVSK